MNINGYKIERELGRGGMATVYLAIQIALERQVALKVMNPALAADEDFKTRFLKEGPIAAKLNDPQIVTIYDTGTDNEHYFLAMEYLPGGTLKQKIKQGLPLERALAIAKMLGSALGYAHSRNVLHRDFKPHNVLFRDNGTPVLTDFGIAKAVGGNSQMTIPGASIGSPMYMSPEQAGGKDLDYRSDIYSLGVVFYEMLTGKPPYQSKDNFALALMHINEPIPQLPGEIDEFQPVLDKLLAKAPDDRFKIAEQFVEALKQAEQHYYNNKKAMADAKPADHHSVAATPKLAKEPEVKPKSSNGPGPVKIRQNDIHKSPGQSSSPKTKKYFWAGLAAATLLVLSIGLWLIPGSGDIDVLLAGAEEHRQKGALDESLELIQKGLVDEPEHPELVRLQSLVEQEQQKLAEASQLLEEAIQLKQSDQIEESLEVIASGLGLAPNNTSVKNTLLELQKELYIKNLLVRAQLQFQEQRLLEPNGDNAFESFMQVLELQEDNQTALDGLQQIASQYFVWARDSQSSGPLSTTQNYIQKGLTVWPGHEGLQALRKEVSQRIEKQEETQAVLARAQQVLQQNNFQESLDIIRNGLQASPNNQEFLNLEQEILVKQTELQRLAKANEFLAEARHLFEQQQFEEALEATKNGLDYAPEHSDLQTLHEQINAKHEKQQLLQQADTLLAEALQLQQQDNLPEALKAVGSGLQLVSTHPELLTLQDELRDAFDRQQGIVELLARARQQLDARRLTVPEGDNALETFQEILRIDPEHEEAHTGLDYIAAEYFRLAKQDQSEGRLQKSLEYIDKGLAIRPQNDDLIALKTAIDNQNKAQLYLVQAKQLQQQDQLEESLQAVEKGLEFMPLDSELLSLQINIQADLHLHEAERLLQHERAFTQSLEEAAIGLQLVPDHPELLELQDGIHRLMQANQHLTEARSLQQQEELQASLEQITLGLQLVPQHAELLALRGELEQQIDLFERTQKADQHLAQANSLNEQGDLKIALQETEKGLALVDEHPGLLVLQNHLIATQLRYAEADALVKQAQQLRDEGRLEEAMQVVEQGLNLLPQYEALFALRQQLVDDLAQQMDLNERQQQATQLFAQAQQQKSAGDFGMGLLRAQQGLRFLPEHIELQELSKELQEQLNVLTQPELALAKSDVQGQALQQIKELLSLAAEQVNRQRLTRPVGNNAFENYQKVLELDPANQTAREGLQTIAGRYLQWAQSNKRRGNLNKSLSNIDRGLSVYPKQKDLQALRREVVALLNRSSRNTTTPTRQPRRIVVDPCEIDRGSKACWCKTFGMLCN